MSSNVFGDLSDDDDDKNQNNVFSKQNHKKLIN